ncbi:MAG: LPS-assembly protein LptD, partial [Gammaproteobacteria bacterium]|nr:LPS-assembly protein LptD [Gammaproteobacteria bacterium]
GPAKPKWEDGEIDRETLQLTADEAELVQDGVSILRGDVQMRKGELQFQAGTVFYDQQAEVLEISDGVRLWDSGIYMSGSRANYDLSSDEGQIDDANYYLLDDHGRGGAGTIRLSSSDILQLEDVSYTTCNPGVEDWVLEADSINLDKVEDVGTARHVKVRFKDVPIFYSPYLTFPLSDKRKSGFLTPSVGSSNETGIDVEIPYYWNIAPERDATFGVRAMAKRGAMLQGEYRYLMRRGDGQLGIEYLPDDNEYDDSRALYSIQHEQTIA